jgi:CDGSH-type Zn-finger protein/truncated hemoglobin YjbI
MSTIDDPTARTPTETEGPLAQVIATRGGKADPEEPLVIEHREALIYMLCEAAELEHGIMCQYLFAAFSLKQRADEGLSEDELASVTRWRKTILHIATQEMLHLALVHNLLSAIGAAPHLARPNLPHSADHYPPGVQLALLPFGDEALRHFMFLERPEGMDLEDAAGLAAAGRAEPHMAEHDIVPRPQDFATIGHLYRSIEYGIRHLAEKCGAEWLFIGPPRAQATQQHFRWPELVTVTDVDSAQRAIDTILDQGEGPRGDWRNAHFGTFVTILDEYDEARRTNPDFDPVRPVMTVNVRPHDRGEDIPLITDTVTARCVDLFNVGYEVLLQILERYFAHTEETDEQLATLADVTLALMFQVIEPLGDLATTRPAGPEYPGKTAGASFELFYENDYLMPHREAAWALLVERLDEAAAFCTRIRSKWGDQVGGALEPVGAALAETVERLQSHFGDWGRPRRTNLATTSPPPPADSTDRDALRERLGQLDRLAGVDGATPSTGLATTFKQARDLADAALEPARPDLRRAQRLVDSVVRPLADALHKGGDAVPNGPPLEHDEDTLWALTVAATSVRATLSAASPPELLEAVAGLQDLALQTSPPAEAAARLAQLQSLHSSLATQIEVATDGPYLVTNPTCVEDWLGTPISTRPQMALCRCGNSSIKPLCDGTHAAIGFSGAKDPKRVPDRRDTYDGVQVSVLDNRGLCQHSGLCTDRLATVFRADQEPFVTPSGGRMDEIIRAVRDCPSGALSYAIDGLEQRHEVDWANQRPATIRITKDGPYRTTGGIELVVPGGKPPARNHGASHEHYALCRCGHSQNKPFCSGMHWYVGFNDPPIAAGTPTVFEWCGGMPALARTTRLLYERHIPDDPLLAPAFADATPDQPRQLAEVLAEVFGGPRTAATPGGATTLADLHGAVRLDDQQRARWVALMLQSADEALLPKDPEFRSVLMSYLEWHARQLLTTTPHEAAQTPADLPRWSWGPAGAPARPAAEPEEQSTPVALPKPGETVSFETHIKPLFRPKDRQSMKFAFDLWSHDEVAQHADDILSRVQAGSMPCDGAWSDDWVATFRRWVNTGRNP